MGFLAQYSRSSLGDSPRVGSGGLLVLDGVLGGLELPGFLELLGLLVMGGVLGGLELPGLS